MKASDFLDYIKDSKSKSTFKEYKSGLAKFVEWYSKSLDEILAERKQDLASDDATQRKRFVREIEKFHKALVDKGYSVNSARTNTLGILQFFRFFEMPITVEKGSSVSQTVETTSDFVPTMQQYRSMFNVADLRGRTILSMALDLGWRISDFLEIKKSDIPDLTQETPMPFDRITEKEKVIAKSFLSAETVELLRTFVPTLKAKNPYLFQSNSEHHLDPESVGDILKGLARKANIRIPEGKRPRFHAFRKRFLSTCADLKIDVNTAKLLVGKDIESSMLAYLSEVNHRKAFIEIKSVLNLSSTPKSRTESQGELEIKVAKLERIVNAIAVLDPSIVEKARAFVEANLGKYGSEIVLDRSVSEMSDAEVLATYWKMVELLAESVKKRTLTPQEREEYQRLLEAENGNNNHE